MSTYQLTAAFASLALLLTAGTATPALIAQIPAIASPTTQPASVPTPDPLGRASPQSSMLGFLNACREGNYVKASRFLDLRGKSQEERARIGPGLAQQLQEILDHSADFDPTQLSNDPLGDLTDRLGPDIDSIETYNINKNSVSLEIHRVKGRISGNYLWLVTPESLARLPELHSLLVETPFEKHLPPPFVSIKFLDTALWQWIAYVLLAFVLVISSSQLSRVVLASVNLLLSQFSMEKREVLAEFARPLWLLLSIAVFRAAFEAIGGSVLVRLAITRILTSLLFIALAWLAADFVDVVAERIRVRFNPRQRAVSMSAFPLFQRVCKIIPFVLAILATLSHWGYNTNTIVAGLGVGGLAVALAAQKTLENFFGGVSVITDRPVLVGDYCRFGAQTGTVEDIGLRSTRIRTLDRTLMTVPNAQFSTMTLENFAARDRFWFHPTINLRGDATTAQIHQVMEALEALLRGHEKVDAGTIPVRFTSIGTYSFELQIFAYITTLDNNEFLRIQTDLLMRILEAVEAAGTGLAVPVQESINPPSATVQPPATVPPPAHSPA